MEFPLVTVPLDRCWSRSKDPYALAATLLKGGTYSEMYGKLKIFGLLPSDIHSGLQLFVSWLKSAKSITFDGTTLEIYKDSGTSKISAPWLTPALLHVFGCLPARIAWYENTYHKWVHSPQTLWFGSPGSLSGDQNRVAFLTRVLLSLMEVNRARHPSRATYVDPAVSAGIPE